MRRNFAFVLVALLFALSVTPLMLNNLQLFSKEQESAQTALLAPSGPDLIQANWTHNHFPNPGFENWYSVWIPDDVYGTTSNDYLTNPVGAPHPVNEGLKSLMMQGRSLDGRALEFDVYNPNLHLAQGLDNLTLRFDWWVDQNIDDELDHDRIYLKLEFYPGWNIYYFLNGSVTAANSTNNAYFFLGGLIQQWNQFSRNITHDILSVPEFGGTIPSGSQLEEVKFTIRIQGGTTQYVRAYFDDVQLINATNGYEWINGTTRNGNFEGIGSWFHFPSGTNPGLRSRSSLAHSGSWSLNQSVISWGNNSWSRSSYSPGVRVTPQNPSELRFWWYLDEVRNPTENTYAYVEIECVNSTADFTFIYFLSHGGTVPHPTIITEFEQYVFYADNFNTTGSWHLFSLDLLTQAEQLFTTDEVLVENIQFYLRTEDTQTRIVLLLDDVSLVASAVNGAGFEDQRSVSEPIRGWGENTEYNEFTVTSTAYAGTKAANLTLNVGDNLYTDQDANYRPLNGTRETYLDIIWRLDQYTLASDNYVILRLSFDDEKSINYILIPTTRSGLTNDSTETYFNVTGIGTLNTWTQMHRDLVHDYEAAFGVIPSVRLTEFQLECSCNTGTALTFLMDDFYLYDDPAPTITNVLQTPQEPWFYDNVSIAADAFDQDLETVLLLYRVDGGSWQLEPMIHQTGDTFHAIIPVQPAYAVVEYYITANDSWGMITTQMNNTNYYSYTVLGFYTGPPPIPWVLIIGAIVAVLIIVVIIIVYYFILRPRQQE